MIWHWDVKINILCRCIKLSHIYILTMWYSVQFICHFCHLDGVILPVSLPIQPIFVYNHLMYYTCYYMVCSTTILLNCMKLKVLFLVFHPEYSDFNCHNLPFNRKKRREPENEANGLKVEPAILSVEVLFLDVQHVLVCPLFL